MSFFEIKNRFTGSVLFSLETETMKLCVEAAIRGGSDLRGSDLRGSDLRGSNLSNSDLRGSNLSNSDLRGSDLRGSDLRGSDLSNSDLSNSDLSGSDLRGSYLSGAKIRDGITITQPPIFLSGLTWDVSIFDGHMKIGCEFYSHVEWESFDDQTIIKMGSSDALKFWRENKEILLTLCRNHAARAQKK